MTQKAISDMIAMQDALTRALDARDVAGIEQSVRALADAVEAVRAIGVVHDPSTTRTDIEHAMKQAEALRMRVNIMTDWTRQRIDRLDELRGQSVPHAYDKVRPK
jgi:hypothetical protein